jgi:hypothetical protein
MIKVILPLILVVVALAVIGPFLTIWALNTVFPVLAIPYTMETWMAMILLGGLFKVSFRS